MVRDDGSRTAGALLARCRLMDTPTLSDALDIVGIDGVLDGLTVRSGTGTMAGIAVTGTESIAPFSSDRIPLFDVGRLIDAVSADTALVIAMDGACVSSFGGLAAKAAQQRGASGVIIDGACRDLPDLQRIGLWVASRHVTPRSGKGRAIVDAVNAPVRFAGVVVEPGDFIVGDATGAVCVPASRIEEVLSTAEELSERDARFSAALSSESFSEISRRLSHC